MVPPARTSAAAIRVLSQYQDRPAVTETVDRHDIRPELTKGATAMNRIQEALLSL